METIGKWSVQVSDGVRQDFRESVMRRMGIDLPDDVEVAWATDEEGPCPVFVVSPGNDGGKTKVWVFWCDSVGEIVHLAWKNFD